MLNYLFFFFSFLFIGNPECFNYQSIIAETSDDETVVAAANEYRLIETESQYTIIAADGLWRRDITLSADFHFAVFNNNCLLFYRQDSYLYLLEINSAGDIVYDGLILHNRIGSKWGIYCDDYIYIFGGISDYTEERFIGAAEGKTLGGDDAFIVKLGYDRCIVDIAVFGGTENESFYAMTAGDDRLYLVGCKMPGGGGDFGNGGRFINTVFVVSLNHDFEIIKYRILSSDKEVILYEHYKERLYLVLSDRLYKFDQNLNTVYRTEIKKPIKKAHLSAINRLTIFTASECYIFNIYNFNCESDFSYPPVNDIYILEKAVYLKTSSKNYYFDVAYLQHFKPPVYYCPSIDYSADVYTLFGTATFISEESDPFFDPCVYGIYQRGYIYSNRQGMEFKIIRDMEVLPEANVDNGGIYPIGYRLQFCGIAYLNGRSILNNYRLDQTGEYDLQLHGANGEVQSISFYVSFNQLNFTEISVMNWDVEVGAGQTFYLELEYDISAECEIIGIMIDDQIIDNLIIDCNQKKINIKMIAPKDPGIYYYYLDKINCRYQGDIIGYNLNQIVCVNVLKAPPEITVSAGKSLNYRIEVADREATARYFSVTVISQQTDFIEKYSLANNNIYLTGLASETEYQIQIGLVYQIGNRIYNTVDLIEAKITGGDEIKLGEIEILEKGETLKQFQINLNKSNKILEVCGDNKILYINQRKNPVYIISLTVAIFIFTVTVAYILKKMRQRKKKKISSPALKAAD